MLIFFEIYRVYCVVNHVRLPPEAGMKNTRCENLCVMWNFNTAVPQFQLHI